MAKKILMIDDDFNYVQAVTTLLETNGYEVESAPNGTEGYDKAKEWMPDLITLDVMMKDDSEGLEVSKRLSSDDVTREIPVILITGIHKPEYLTVDFSTGEKILDVRATLEKPIKPEQLLKVIKQHIE